VIQVVKRRADGAARWFRGDGREDTAFANSEDRILGHLPLPEVLKGSTTYSA